MKVHYSMSAQLALRRSEKRELIRQKIEQLAIDPESLASNVKRLHGRKESRLRVQDWRVIFRIEGDVLHVREIGPRGSIY